MSRQRIVQALKPRSGITFAKTSSFLHIPCHDGAGTNISARRIIQGVEDIISFPVQGTTAGLWASPYDGFVTAQGDNLAVVQGGFGPMIDLRNFSGTLLLFALLQEVSTATAATAVFSFGRPYYSSAGGITLQLNASSVPQLAVTWQGNNLVITATGEATQSGTSRAYMGAITKSGSDIVLSIFSDGIQSGATAGDNATYYVNPYYVAGGKDQDACVLFARPGFNYASPSNQLTAGMKMADLMAFRTEQDLTADLQTIAAEHAKYPREFLWSLNGV